MSPFPPRLPFFPSSPGGPGGPTGPIQSKSVAQSSTHRINFTETVTVSRNVVQILFQRNKSLKLAASSLHYSNSHSDAYDTLMIQ